MILQFDMGNTRTKWRLQSGGGTIVRGELEASAGFSSLSSRLSAFAVDEVWVVSVVAPSRNDALSVWAQKSFGVLPRFAYSSAEFGAVKNGYSVPQRLGADRWLAIVAAFKYACGACIVVDCGSAITVDLLEADGVHLGGYIAPGLLQMQRSLALHTYAVDIAGSLSGASPGRDTKSAVLAGQSAMVMGLIHQARAELVKVGASPELILTGGDSRWLTQVFPGARFIPDLVFDGLEQVLTRNQ